MESEKENFFRFICLITEIVGEVFRYRLKQSYKNSHVQTLPSFLKNTGVLHTIFHLFFPTYSCCWKGCRKQLSRIFSTKQWNILYDCDPSRCCNQNQKDPNKICLCCVSPKNVDESDLDLSLLSIILINCCNLMPNELEAVQRLRQMKNEYISHNPNCSLSHLDFKSLLENTKNYIQHLDSTNIYLKNHLNVLNRPLDESLMQKYFMYYLESTSIEKVRYEQMKRVHAGIKHVKRGNENLIEAVNELKSSFRHQRDGLELDIKTKRKRQEMSECFDAPNEQDKADDCISTKIKVQKLMKLSGNTDDRIYKQPDTKPLDLNREFISSKLLGSDLSTAVNLQMDYTVFTMKDLSKQPGFKKMDKFICGKCSWLFTSLDQFMQHKVECKNKQKEDELIKNEYKNYIISRITIPTEDHDLSHEIEKDWQQGILDPKHNSMEVKYMTVGCVVVWMKVDVLLFLDTKHFYSALDDLVNDIFQKYAVKTPFYRVHVFDIATGYVDHIADEFYCGDCTLTFDTLDKFISHKNDRCFQHLRTENDVICPMDMTLNETGDLSVESNVQQYRSIALKPKIWCNNTIQKASPAKCTTSGLISVNNANQRKKLQKRQYNHKFMKDKQHHQKSSLHTSFWKNNYKSSRYVSQKAKERNCAEDGGKVRMIQVGSTGSVKNATGNTILGGGMFQAMEFGSIMTANCNQVEYYSRIMLDLVNEILGLHDFDFMHEIYKWFGMKSPRPVFARSPLPVQNLDINKLEIGVSSYEKIVFTSEDISKQKQQTNVGFLAKVFGEMEQLYDFKSIHVNNILSKSGKKRKINFVPKTKNHHGMLDRNGDTRFIRWMSPVKKTLTKQKEKPRAEQKHKYELQCEIDLKSDIKDGLRIIQCDTAKKMAALQMKIVRLNEQKMSHGKNDRQPSERIAALWKRETVSVLRKLYTVLELYLMVWKND